MDVIINVGGAIVNTVVSFSPVSNSVSSVLFWKVTLNLLVIIAPLGKVSLIKTVMFNSKLEPAEKFPKDQVLFVRGSSEEACLRRTLHSDQTSQQP